MDILLLAAHTDPRTILFQAALNKAGLAPAKVMSYQALAESPDVLLSLCAPTSPVLLRVESSGSDLHALQVILEKGEHALQVQGEACYWSTRQIAQAIRQTGRLVPSHQYNAGLRALLQGLNTFTKQSLPKLRYMNPVEDSLLMNDKAACHAYLHRHDIPVAPALSTPDNPVQNYEDLRSRMQQQNRRRVFVKLCHGAGAAGIVALETSSKRALAKTTVECVDSPQGRVLYNSTRIQRINDEAKIGALIDALCQMHIHVEGWIPKAQVAGHSVDLRILVIGGEVCHQVLRMSRSPITNLHLLNQRSEVTPLTQKMSDEAWQSVQETCLNVARLFPQCTYVALDVLVDISLKRHAVLEVNAFGDFVKNVLHRGLTPHDCEIQALKAIHAQHFC